MTAHRLKTFAFSTLHVRALATDRRRGIVVAGPLRIPCALGRGGIVHAKREGDGGTPAGSLALGRLWRRADRTTRPRTALFLQPTRPDDGWCDAPAHARYNRPVRLPFPASHERMWRGDALYDFVLELGWNVRPAVRGRGSAIFLHLARPNFAPTEGCVALRRADLLKLLPRLSPRTRIRIG